MLRTAASIADGQHIDLGDVAANIDRRALTLVLAAIAHAGGSHGDRDITHDADGVPGPEGRCPR